MRMLILLLADVSRMTLVNRWNYISPVASNIFCKTEILGEQFF